MVPSLPNDTVAEPLADVERQLGACAPARDRAMALREYPARTIVLRSHLAAVDRTGSSISSIPGWREHPFAHRNDRLVRVDERREREGSASGSTGRLGGESLTGTSCRPIE
jgi:hypothetical protein